MKYKVSLIFFLLICLLNAGCSNSDEQIIRITTNNKVEVIRPIKDTSVTTNKLYDYIDPVTYIQIKNKDAPIFTTDLKVSYHNDLIFIADTKQSILGILDLNGNFKKVGDIGLRPGEYPSIEDVNIDTYENTILVLSNEKGALIKYSLTGEYISEEKLSFHSDQFVVLDTNFLAVFINQNKSKASGSNNLLITDKRGDIKQRLFNFDNYPIQSFAYTGFLSRGSSASLFCLPFSDSIYEIKSNNLYLKYIISFEGKDFPIPKKRSENKQFQKTMNYSFLLKPTFESKKYFSFVYVNNRRLSVCILNKDTHKTLSTGSIENNLFFEIYGFPVGLKDDDTFISVIDLAKLKSKIKKTPKLLDEIKQFDKKLFDIIEFASPFDNSIIAFYKFKVI